MSWLPSTIFFERFCCELSELWAKRLCNRFATFLPGMSRRRYTLACWKFLKREWLHYSCTPAFVGNILSSLRGTHGNSSGTIVWLLVTPWPHLCWWTMLHPNILLGKLYGRSWYVLNMNALFPVVNFPVSSSSEGNMCSICPFSALRAVFSSPC